VTDELDIRHSAGPAAGGVLLQSTDALAFVALLCLGAVALVAVAVFAPIALLLFAILGAAGLNREARRWRVAERF
jgi:Flp pilus assembly protein TadB